MNLCIHCLNGNACSHVKAAFQLSSKPTSLSLNGSKIPSNRLHGLVNPAYHTNLTVTL